MIYITLSLGEEIPQEEPDRQPDNNPFDEPQNPFDEQPPPAENPFDEQPPPSTTAPADTCTEGKNSALIDSWLPDVQFVDNNDVPVSRDRIDSADVIGVCTYLCMYIFETITIYMYYHEY